MIEIIPAILTNSIQEVQSKLGLLEGVYDTGKVQKVQIDIIDGEFVDNKTIDPSGLTGIDTSLSLDFHLMVKEPLHWIEKCANAGANRIIGQIEMMKSQLDFVGRVQEYGLYVGLAVDLETPISELDPLVLTNVDIVLLMAVPAGWGGQKFDKRVLDKIKKLDEVRVRDKTPFKICVDGGETEEVIDDTHMAGADEVAIGGRLFAGNIEENIMLLQKAAHRI